MNDKEISILKRKLKTNKLYWRNDDSDFLKVFSITQRNGEFSLCANLIDGTYCALYDSELTDFFIITQVGVK